MTSCCHNVRTTRISLKFFQKKMSESEHLTDWKSTFHQLIRCVVCKIYSQNIANYQLSRRNIKRQNRSSRCLRRFRRTYRQLIQNCLHILQPQIANGTLAYADHVYEQRVASSSSIDIIIKVVSDCMGRSVERPVPPPLVRTKTAFFGISEQHEQDCSLRKEEVASYQNVHP